MIDETPFRMLEGIKALIKNLECQVKNLKTYTDNSTINLERLAKYNKEQEELKKIPCTCGMVPLREHMINAAHGRCKG